MFKLQGHRQHMELVSLSMVHTIYILAMGHLRWQHPLLLVLLTYVLFMVTVVTRGVWNYPSWTFSALSYNEIPLNNPYLNYFNTFSYSDSITGIFGISTASLLNGQKIRFKDGGGYAANESVRLVLNHNTSYI